MNSEINTVNKIESIIDVCERVRADGGYVTTYRSNGEVYFTVIHDDDIYEDLTSDDLKEIF